MRNLICYTISAAATIAIASPVAAAITITDYQFSVVNSGGVGNQTGSFTLQYDDVSNYYELLEIDYSIGDYIYTLENTGAVSLGDGFGIGGILNGEGNLFGFSEDFRLTYSPTAGPNLVFATSNTTLQMVSPPELRFSVVEPMNGAVPEPATWAMMLLGFFGIGAIVRRRKTAPSPQVSYAF